MKFSENVKFAKIISTSINSYPKVYNVKLLLHNWEGNVGKCSPNCMTLSS